MDAQTSFESGPLHGIDLQDGIPQDVTLNLKKKDGTFKTMEELKQEILELVTREVGNISEVSRVLQVGRSTLYRRMNKC